MSLASIEFDEWNTLPSISVPVLVLAGENDRVTRFDVNQQLQQRIPAARLVSFRPAGHYALFEHHEAFSKVVAEFVESCQGDSAGSLGSSGTVGTGNVATELTGAHSQQ